MKKLVSTIVMFTQITACTTYSRYVPAPGQNAVYEDGVASLSSQGTSTRVKVQPLQPMQEDGERHGFSLYVENIGPEPFLIGPHDITFTYQGKTIPALTYEERIDEIESAKRAKMITLAVLGVLAAAGGAYAASHRTYNTSGWVGNTRYGSQTTVTDPVAGVLVGTAAAGGTVYGISMAQATAELQKQGAEGLLKMNTVEPNNYRGGIISPDSSLSSKSGQSLPLTIGVKIGADHHSFTFLQERAGK